MTKTFFKNQKGYAILFTIVIVSAISVITAGLSNTAYKQLMLSSLAKDSQTAFYQSDTATDCALYADMVVKNTNPIFTTGGSWSCGGYDLLIVPVDPTTGSYNINPPNEDSLNPCFRITVTKTNGVDGEGNSTTNTEIKAKGYNICKTDNVRTVEREIQINY